MMSGVQGREDGDNSRTSATMSGWYAASKSTVQTAWPRSRKAEDHPPTVDVAPSPQNRSRTFTLRSPELRVEQRMVLDTSQALDLDVEGRSLAPVVGPEPDPL